MRRTNMKKIISSALASIMTAIIISIGALSSIAYALTKDGTALVEDKSEFMSYSTDVSNCFNIMGKYNDSFIKTTYSNNGYKVGIKIGSGIKNSISIGNGEVTTIDGIDLQLKLEMIENGRSIRVSYIMQNNSTSSKTVSVGSSGDTMIGNNDRARVTRTSDGFVMTDDDTSNSTYGAKFNLTGDFTTTWIGYYGNAYDNIFENATESYVENIDSGLAYSWTVKIPAGQSVTKSCIFKVDSVLELGDCTVSADVSNNQLIVTAPYVYQAGKIQQLNYSIDNGTFSTYGATSTAASDGSGAFTDIAIDIAALNWKPGSTHTIAFYINEIPSANSKLKTRTLTYSVYWPPTFSEGEQQQTIKFANSYTLFADIISKKGDTITLPSDAQNGYAFMGWDTKSDGTGTRYLAGMEYLVNSNATLYAQWEKAYKASVSTLVDGYKTSMGYNIKLKHDTYGTYDNDSYVPAGTYKIYFDGVDTGSTITVDNATAYAYFYYYTVSYNPGEGDMEDIGISTLLRGSTYEITANDPVRTCYIFDGWEYNGNTYNKGDSFTVNSKTVLTAGWSANHTFGEYIYNNDATPDKDGTSTRECSVCHTKETVTVSGTAEIEKLYKEIIDIADELSGENITSDDMEKLHILVNDRNALISNELFNKYISEENKRKVVKAYEFASNKMKTIEDAADAMEVIKSAMNILPDKDTINTSYEENVTGLKSKLENYLVRYADVLSDSEKAEAQDMLSRITEFDIKIADIKENIKKANETISELSDIAYAKTTDETQLKEIKAKLEEILNKYEDNLTESQIKEIRDSLSETNSKLNNISEIKSQLNNAEEAINNIPDMSDVSVNDKTSVEEIKEQLNDILDSYGDNLTEEQKQKINDAIERTEGALSMVGLIEEKDAAILEIDKAAEEAKKAIDAMEELTDTEKDAAKKAVEDKATDAKKEIEAVTTPDKIQQVVNQKAETKNYIADIKDKTNTLNNNIKESEAIYVDEKGNTHYGTLKEIIDNSPGGSNIVIRNNITILDNIVLDSDKTLEIPKDKTITIINGGTFEIKEGSKLSNEGNITVDKDSVFKINGSVGEKIGEGEATVIVNPSQKDSEDEIKANLVINDMKKFIESSLGSDVAEDIEGGYNVSLRLTVKKASESNKKEDISGIKQFIKNYEPGNNKILEAGEFLDILYEVMFNGGEWTAITSTNDEIEITIQLPESLKGKGTYYIIRNHNGVCTILNDLDNDDDTITFKTDSFSTYAIAYEVEKSAEPEKPSDDVPAGRMGMALLVIMGLISMMTVVVVHETSGKCNDWYC